MIEPMQKIRIIVPQEQLRQVLEKLALLAVIDLTELKKISQATYTSSNEGLIQQDLQTALSLKEFLKQEKIQRKNKGLEPLAFLKMAQEKLKTIEALKKEIQALEKEAEFLKPLSYLNSSSKEGSNLVKIGVSIFIGPFKSHQEFQEKLKGKIEWQIAGPLSEGSKVAILYLYPKKFTPQVLKQALNFKLQEMPLPQKPPASELKKINQELTNIKQRIENLKKELKENSPTQKVWEAFLLDLAWEKQIQELLAKIPRTSKFALLEGWTLKRCLPDLKKALAETSPHFIFQALPFDPNEAPVALRNKLARPFELITTLYGMPQPTELDPTPFLMPFFVVFFGFALSEVGYGLSLTILGILTLFFKHKLAKIWQQTIITNIGILLVVTGLSSVIFGYVLGTLFGINISAIINPQLEATKVLGLCFALGILQVMTGLAINFRHKLKQGLRFANVMNESGFWLIALLAILILILQNIFGSKFIAEDFLIKTAGLALILNVFCWTIFSSQPLKSFLKGLASLYNCVNFLADILSYSRLFALGLATGVIASTVNIVANIAKDMVNWPFLSYIIFFAILIAGHLFNLIINVLGAFIHSARLQFVEFFPKFLEGGGRQFSPLSYKKTNNQL